MPFFAHDGLNFYYEEHGSGDPVLLMHGFSMSGRDMERLALRLAEKYRVITPDFRCHGLSEPKPCDFPPTFYQRHAEDMAALLRHLRINRAHLTGFSDGGEVALLMALDHPDMARSVVAWGAAGVIDGAEAPAAGALYNLIDRPTEGMYAWRNALVESYGVDNARVMTQGFVLACNAIASLGGDIALSRAGKLKSPVLIINGEDDASIPAQLAATLAAAIPDSRLEIVPGAGHAIHEDEADWFARTMLEWLGSH